MLGSYDIKLIELRDSQEYQFCMHSKVNNYFRIITPPNTNTQRYGLPIDISISNIGKQENINFAVFLSPSHKQPHLGDNHQKYLKEKLGNEQTFKIRYGSKGDKIKILYMNIVCQKDATILVKTKFNIMFEI